MATYLYETTGEPIRQFEIQQSMKDAPLTEHPESGEPIRRVITGGYGLMTKGGTGSSAAAAAPSPAHSCRSGGCGCA